MTGGKRRTGSGIHPNRGSLRHRTRHRQRRVHKVGASLGATVGIGFAAFFVVGIVGLSCMYPGPGWSCDWGAAVVALTVLGLALAGIAWTNWRIWRKR